MELARPLLLLAVVAAASTPAAPGAAQSAWSQRLVGPRARGELRHPEAAVRVRAAQTLGRHGEPHRALASLLDAFEAEEDLGVRGALLDAIARRGDESAVPRLAQRLGDLSREDRAAVLHVMGAIGGESSIRALAEWLGAPDVGEDAIEALAWIGPGAVPHLLRALRAPATAERAARALGAIGDARATPALVASLEGALPAVRVAIVEALGRIGDERAAPAVAQALGDSAAPVVDAALASLPRVGGPDHAPLVARLTDEGWPALRALAIEALVALDPAAAAPRAQAILADAGAPLLRAAVVRAVLARPSRELVPVLATLALDPALRGEATEALARVPEGAGLAALLEVPDAELAVALALRRHAPFAGASSTSRAQQRLRADASLRGAVVRALASDASALPRLENALGSASANERALGALGIALLGRAGARARARVEEQLVAEDDPRVFRALALSASALGASVESARLDARTWDAETAPEALWMAAEGLARASPTTRRRMLRAMRRGLRASEPRVRSGAALALGRAADAGAWRALAALLEDEHDTVRLAAARALATIAAPESRAAVASRERVERDREVRGALRRALSGAPAHAPPAWIAGREVLYVRVITAPGARSSSSEPIELDVLLPDGRWLRTITLPSGEALLPDLPAGEAEVRVRL